MMDLKYWILIFLATFQYSKAELFSSVNDFQELVHVESEYVGVLRNFVANQRKNLNNLERFLEKLEAENAAAKEDPIKYVSNPLNSFLLTKRLTTDINKILDDNQETVDEFSEAVGHLANSSLMSSIDEDKAGIVVALAHLQQVYDLKTSDLAKGIIKGQKFRADLSFEDSFEMASMMSNNNECNRAVEWFEEAKTMLQDESDEIPFYEAMKNNFLKCNRTEDAKFISSLIAEIKSKKRKELPKDEQTVVNEDLDDLYAQVCSGKFERVLKPNLNCFFASNYSYLKMFRFRAEILNVDPPVYLFHDVISDQEIDELLALSKESLSRAEIENDVPITLQRTAKLFWHHNQNELIDSLTKRVELLTGLSTETSDPLQVQNYGVGGRYVYHHDYFGNLPNNEVGDRISTFMFYLSNIEMGGGTAFVNLKLLMPAKKGSAIFWYNLRKSLNEDHRTLHAACPVLIGNKWVANKWIRSAGQIFTRPCDLIDDTLES